MIWSIACMAKLKVMNSTIGLRPVKAAPTPRPANPCSVIGVSTTRRGPKSCRRARRLGGGLVGAGFRRRFSLGGQALGLHVGGVLGAARGVLGFRRRGRLG